MGDHPRRGNHQAGQGGGGPKNSQGGGVPDKPKPPPHQNQPPPPPAVIPPASDPPASGLQQPPPDPSPPTGTPAAPASTAAPIVPPPIVPSLTPPPDPISSNPPPSLTPDASATITPSDTNSLSQNPVSEAGHGTINNGVATIASSNGLPLSPSGSESSVPVSSVGVTLSGSSSEALPLPTSVSTNGQSFSPIASASGDPKTNQNGRIIAAIVVPVILLLAVLGLGAGCFICRRRRRAATRLSLRSFDSREAIEEMQFSRPVGESYSATISSGREIPADYITHIGPSAPELFVPSMPSSPAQDSLRQAFHYTAFNSTNSQILSAPELDLHDVFPRSYVATSPAPSSLVTESSHVHLFHHLREMRRQGDIVKSQSSIRLSVPRNDDGVEGGDETRTAATELTVAASGPDGHAYPRDSYVSDDVKTVYAI